MTGRGAWNNAGLGGTKKYKSTEPGPYYYIGSGSAPDGRERDANENAVYLAVAAFQRALNRRLTGDDLVVDGYFGEETSAAVTRFQEKNVTKTGTPWGGIGPQTAEALLKPDLRKVVKEHGNSLITVKLVSGTVRHESLWDAGAVGYVDDRDVGLAQINAEAHPDMSTEDRLKPINSFRFICDYYENALSMLDNVLRDAVASYNLGIGGARQWIAAGRPDIWVPAGSERARDVKGYIDSILAG